MWVLPTQSSLADVGARRPVYDELRVPTQLLDGKKRGKALKIMRKKTKWGFFPLFLVLQKGFNRGIDDVSVNITTVKGGYAEIEGDLHRLG